MADSAPRPLPTWALGARCVDFISDVHLTPEMPRTAEAFLGHLKRTPADTVLLLGDLFEAWVGDDATSNPGFEADCVAAMRSAAATRTLALLPGNRDFLLGDAFARASGVRLLSDPTLLHACNQRLLLTHGDAWVLSDTAYQATRRTLRSAAWKHAFLAQPLAARRVQAEAMRAESMAHQAGRAAAPEGDVDETLASQWLAATGADALIHGHTHRPATHALPGGALRHVLTDWDLDTPGVPPRAEVLHLTANGLTRTRPC